MKKFLCFVLSVIAIVLCFRWNWRIGVMALLCLFAYGTFWFLWMMVHAGLRNRFPYDFITQIQWMIDYFKKQGYYQKEIQDEGLDDPKYIMSKGNNTVTIILNAPLSAKKKDWTIGIVLNDNKWTFPLDCDRTKVCEELDAYIESYMDNNVNGKKNI